MGNGVSIRNTFEIYWLFMNCQLFLKLTQFKNCHKLKNLLYLLAEFFLEFYAFFHWIFCMYLFSWAGCELLHSECKFLTMSLNFAETMLISNKFWRLLKELVNVHEIVLIFSCCIKCAAFANVAMFHLSFQMNINEKIQVYYFYFK